MYYKDLDQISVGKFIEVFCGNLDALVVNGSHRQDDLSYAAKQMINEYMSIIGGKVLLAEISRKNEIINLRIKIDCMEACLNLIKINDWKHVCDMLSAFGYTVDVNDKEKINQRISSISANCKYRYDKLTSVNSASTAVMDRDYFTRERVMVMGHFKMHIDKDVFTAKEYAFLVKRMCDDIDSMNRRSNH